MEKNRGLRNTLIRYVAFQSVSMLGLSLYILADTYFIARGVGSAGLTALNLVLPVYSVLSGLGLLLGVGGATVYAVGMGRGREGEGEGVFSTALAAALAAGLLFTLICGVGADPLAGLLGASGQVREMAAAYLRTISLFAVFFMANQVLVAFVRNDGEPGRATAGMLIGCGANILLDWLLIFPLGLGMFGAALATCMAPIIGILVQLGHFRRGRGKLALRRPVPRALPGLTVAGVPSMITELSSGMVLLLFNYTILGLAGDLGVAAYGIVANLALVVAALFTGVAQGVQPVISYRHGAGEGDKVRYAIRFGAVLAVSLGALILLGGLLGADGLAALFDRDGDPRLTGMAARGIRLYFIAFPFMGLSMVATAALAAVTRTGPAMALSLLRGLVLLLPGVLLMSALWGMTGVWLTVPAVEGLTAVLSAVLLLRDGWRAGPPRAGAGSHNI